MTQDKNKEVITYLTKWTLFLQKIFFFLSISVLYPLFFYHELLEVVLSIIFLSPVFLYMWIHTTKKLDFSDNQNWLLNDKNRSLIHHSHWNSDWKWIVAKTLITKYLKTNFLIGHNSATEYVVTKSVTECLVPTFLEE